MESKIRANLKIEKKKENVEYKEVKTTLDVNEANQLITKGWLLLSACMGHVDSGGFNAKVHYILARR